MTDRPASTVRANLRKLYAIQALTQAMFAIPIIYLFWAEHGLTLQQVFLLQSGFAFTILALEIPTGYVADRWGRKKTLILAGCFDVLGYLVYASGGGFRQFLLAEMVIGLGVSLRSGSIEAITYDTLLELGEEKRYRRVAGNQNFLEFNAEAASSLVGGAIAMFSLALPLWLTTIPAAAALLIACTLREPARRLTRVTGPWRMIWEVSRHTLLRHRGLRSVILLHGLIFTMALTFFWFFQPYQTLVGFPVALFGVSHAVIVAAGAGASWYSSRLEKQVDDRLLLMAIALAIVGGYFLLSLPPALWLLPAFLLSRIAWGFLGPLTADMVNRMTTSDVRATVLSLRSFLPRLVFVCTSSFVGLLADARSIPLAMLTAGCVGGLALVLAFVSLRSVWREIPA